MKKIIAIHTGLLVIVLAVLGYSYLRYWNIATVNGVGVSRLDYIKTLENLGGKQTLSTMIDDTLVLREAALKGMKLDQKAVDLQIAKIEEQLKAQNETLDAALAANNMTRADLIKQITIKQFETALSASNVTISQAQIDDFLNANKANLPAGKSKEELQTLAKSQLELEANQSAASTWLANLRKNAKIIYK